MAEEWMGIYGAAADDSPSHMDVRFHVSVCPSMEHVIPNVGGALHKHACGDLNLHRAWKIVDDLRQEHDSNKSRETAPDANYACGGRAMDETTRLADEVLSGVEQYLMDLLNEWNAHLVHASALRRRRARHVVSDSVYSQALQNLPRPSLARPASLVASILRFKASMLSLQNERHLRPDILRCKSRFEARLSCIQRPLRRAFLRMCVRFLTEENVST